MGSIYAYMMILIGLKLCQYTSIKYNMKTILTNQISLFPFLHLNKSKPGIFGMPSLATAANSASCMAVALLIRLLICKTR